MDISIILPVVNERDNLKVLIPRMRALMEREALNFEIVVIDGNSSDGTREAATELGARVLSERRRGYAGAMETGFARVVMISPEKVYRSHCAGRSGSKP